MINIMEVGYIDTDIDIDIELPITKMLSENRQK